MMHLSPVLTGYLVFIAAAMGLTMGSFFQAFAWRICHGESILSGRSHCPVCDHKLGPGDLVPLFSFLALRGRCRYCGTKISWRYPMSEALCAIGYVTLLCRFDVSMELARMLVFFTLLFFIALVDWESYTIPDQAILTGIVLFIPLALLSSAPAAVFKAGLIGAFAISVPLLLFSLLADQILKKESLGGGDIKLFFLVGLYLDAFQTLLTLILACLLGIVLGLFFAARQKKDGFRPIPFGPPIAAAAWVVMLAGQTLLQWYTGLFY